jgi:hypothetical protein
MAEGGRWKRGLFMVKREEFRSIGRRVYASVQQCAFTIVPKN